MSAGWAFGSALVVYHSPIVNLVAKGTAFPQNSEPLGERLHFATSFPSREVDQQNSRNLPNRRAGDALQNYTSF
jgi:hypothetical protein